MRFYDRLLDAMAALGAAMLVAVTAILLYDVASRSLGLPVIDWAVAVTEYAMLYVTALAAPWLVRERGHVCVDILRPHMPAGVNGVLAKLVYALALLFSLVFVAFSVPVIRDSWHEFDTRAFDMPRWLLFLPLAVSFVFIAIEFGRYLFTRRSYYEASTLRDEGL